MLGRIHTESKECACDVLLWPGMCKEIEMVLKCTTCQEYLTAQQKEHLLPHNIPVHPWQSVATYLIIWWLIITATTSRSHSLQIQELNSDSAYQVSVCQAWNTQRFDLR